MNPRESFGLYLRPDFRYKGKKSINGEMMRSAIYADRKIPKYLAGCKWFAYFCIGVATGIVAFLMD